MRGALARFAIVVRSKLSKAAADADNAGDMFTGDALIQCAAFGELKYS